jgi:hypothetical protein
MSIYYLIRISSKSEAHIEIRVTISLGIYYSSILRNLRRCIRGRSLVVLITDIRATMPMRIYDIIRNIC